MGGRGRREQTLESNNGERENKLKREVYSPRRKKGGFYTPHEI
jgi:hypothetical protein